MPAAQNGDGAAIECFENAEAICVSRDRVAPVKTMNDLVALWSNAFEMTDDSRLIAVNREAHRLREIDLDERYYRTVQDLEARFPSGVPSLAKSRRFAVCGDHCFVADVAVVGDVQLVNESETPVHISAGIVLEGKR